MSSDLTPREYLALEQWNIKNGHGSIWEFMRSTTVTYNGETTPLHTKEEIAQREQFPLLGKLLNSFSTLYEELSKTDGGLEFLAQKDRELAAYIESGTGNQDSLLIRWFEGKLDDCFYFSETNEKHFLDILPAEAALTKGPENVLQLAYDLDQFAQDYDTYEYSDQVEDRERHILEIEDQIISGNIRGLTEYLLGFIEDSEPSEAVHSEAKTLIARLDKVVSVTPDMEGKRPALDAQIDVASIKCQEGKTLSCETKDRVQDRGNKGFDL